MASSQDVTNLYQQLLGRAPDQQGLDWYQQFDPNSIKNDIMGGSEYKAYQANQPKLTTSQQLINQLSGSIQPQKAFDQTLSYDNYAAPQRAVLDQLYQQQALPQFQNYTLNPFNEQYANGAAAGGTNQMGNGQTNYQNALYGVQTPFNNQWDSAKTSYENMIRNGYNQKIQDYYKAPNLNFNINALT